MMLNPFDEKKLACRFPGALFRPLEDGEDFEAGKTYFCGYWHQFFTVLDVNHNAPVWGTTYSCLWEDGTTTTHSTRPDVKRDFEIIKNN